MTQGDAERGRHAVPAAAGAPGAAGRAARAAGAAPQGGDRRRHAPDRGPGGSPERGGGPGLRQPAQAGPGGEDAAGAGGAVRQADGAVDRHGGELQPGPQGDRRRGELGAQHRAGHAHHRHGAGVRLQGAAAARLLLSSPPPGGGGPNGAPRAPALAPGPRGGAAAATPSPAQTSSVAAATAVPGARCPQRSPPAPPLPHHVAVRLAGGAGLGAGLAGAGPAAAAVRAGQARLHHRLRQRLRQPAGAAAGPARLPRAGRLPDPPGGRGAAAGLRRAPPHHPAGRHPLRQRPPRCRVGAGGGGRERALRAGEQRGGGQPHRPHGVDADRGLPAGDGRQRLRGHRGDAGAAAAAEAGAGPRGEHLQRARPPLRQRRRLLPLQVLHRGLLRQPAARHAALRGEGEHRGARLLQDGRHRPGGHRGGPAAALGAPGPGDAAQLRRGFLPQVPEGAAAHHERHLRRGPGQGDRLHGARPGRPAPAHPLQRGLGRQAALAARLLPARLPRRLGPGPHPAQAGALPALGAPPRCPPPLCCQ